MFREFGVFSVQGLVDGIQANAASAVQSAVNLAVRITNAFRSNLDIRSPSGVFRELGRMVMAGLGLGMEDEAAPVVERVSDLGDRIRSEMEKVAFDMGAMLAEAASGKYMITGSLRAGDPGSFARVAEGVGLEGTARIERKSDQLIGAQDAQARAMVGGWERTSHGNTQTLVEQNERIGRDQMAGFVQGVVAAQRAFAGSEGFKDSIDSSILEMVGRVNRENPEVS